MDSPAKPELTHIGFWMVHTDYPNKDHKFVTDASSTTFWEMRGYRAVPAYAYSTDLRTTNEFF